MSTNLVDLIVIGEMFSGFLPSQRFVLLLALMGCVTIAFVVTVVMIATTVQTIHRNRAEADLKQEMLERGLSAEEVARVVEARTPENFLDRWASNRAAARAV